MNRAVQFAVVIVAVVLSMAAVQVALEHVAPTSSLHSEGKTVSEMAGEMKIFTDPGNGCQYVGRSIAEGSLIPRMGADGKQVCRQGAQP